MIARYMALLLFMTLPIYAHAATFDDFSSIAFDPITSGSITVDGTTVTFLGDDGAIITDPHNGSTNAIILGDNVPSNRVAALTLSFSNPISELELEFDAMHQSQNDSVTSSLGTWTSFPSTLSLSGSTLSSTAPVINPGGSGIDDELFTVLTFVTPVNSVTLTNVGAFTLDSLTIVPEPSTLVLLSVAAIMRVRGRRRAVPRERT